MATHGGPVMLSVNAGSSSVKCALFSFEAQPHVLARETIAGAAASGVAGLIQWADSHTSDTSLVAIGHRIVHGGPAYREPRPITAPLVEALKQLIPFAPNHLPDEIALIAALAQWRPSVQQVACFDTAFHAGLPDVARRLPIPQVYDDQGIRRYGFHGLSYAFLMQELERLAGPAAAAGNVILAHLGSGSSLAAVRDGHCIDTTMGFTPIGGVIMSTRSGDLDPGVVTYIARTEGLTPDQVEDLLSHRTGLFGISGATGDVRTLLDRESHDPASRLAIAMYAYSIKKAIGALAAALGGVDTLIFSGGIGEHAPAIRSRVCEGLTFLGVRLDTDANAANAPVISPAGANVAVRVIPTDEELMIARAAYSLQGAR
jgi:acetate kinase